MMRSRIIFRSVIIISCRADRSSIEVARSVHCVSVGMANCSFLRISWRCLLIWRSCAAVAVWLAAACSVSCCDSCAAVAACSVSCRDSCAVVAADRLAAGCSVSCRVAVACDSADRLAAACDISGFSGYFSAIFVKRLLLLSSCWRRGRFSFSNVVVVDWAASFRFTVTGNSMKTFFCSMDIEEWR